MSATDFVADLFTKVFGAFGRWLKKVRDAVLGSGGMPDPSAVLGRRSEWNREVENLMPSLETIAAAGWVDGSGHPYVSTSTFIMADLARAKNFLRNVANEVYALLVAEMIDGQQAGEGVDELRTRIERVLDLTGTNRWANRAQVIAQTECLAGDSLITSANVAAAYRRWYEGPWVEVVTQSGNQLSGTPNHPVLTRRGWVGLGLLTEGDDLICDDVQLQHAMASGHPHVEACPSTIAQLFDSLAAVRVLGGVRAGEPDFHGDGREGDVDVALPYRPLRVGRFAPVEECRAEVVLEGADLHQVLLACEGVRMGPGVCACELGGLAEVAHGVTGRLDESRHRVTSAADIASHALRAFALEVAGDDRLAVQVLTEAGVAAATIAGGAPCCRALADGGTAALEVAHDRVDAVAGLLADGGDADPSQIKLDQVMAVRRIEFAGHVYNLTTVDGYFAYRGAYTGNTNRAWNAGVYASALYYEPATGAGWSKVWVTRDDQRERPAHRAADGQTVPLRDYFQVGGVPMRYPGDPAAPPELVINCRCSIDLVKTGEAP